MVDEEWAKEMADIRSTWFGRVMTNKWFGIGVAVVSLGADAVGAAGAVEATEATPLVNSDGSLYVAGHVETYLAVPSEPAPRIPTETYYFWDVEGTRGTFRQVEGPPNRPPDRISPEGFNKAGEPLISFYWDEPGGMYRQSNHWGQLGSSNWSLVGPDGWVASPGKFQMFYDNIPTGYISYTDLTQNIRLLNP